MTDATAWQEKAPNDATAWPTRTRDRGHAPEITEYAPSEFWSPFWPRSMYRQHRPEVIKCGNASIQRELAYFSPFNDLDLVEREIFSLSLLGFRISSCFKSNSGSRFNFILILLLFIYSNIWIDYYYLWIIPCYRFLIELMIIWGIFSLWLFSLS